MWRGMALVSGLALFLLAALSRASAEPTEYLLGEGDLVRLVAPGEEELGGVYRLGANGRIGLPVDERVDLGGLTIDAAAELVREALSGQIRNPAVGLEIAERRSFFITGDVAEPGAYPHAPGLTLGKAMALAGGPYRFGDSEGIQETITEVRADEEFGGALFDLAAARLRAARIEAALSGQVEFDSPKLPVGADEQQVARLEARERAIARTSSEAYADRMDLLSRQLEAREAEIRALEERIGTSEARADRIDEEIATVDDLLARGLSTNERLDSLFVRKEQAQSNILQISVLLNQAREERLGLQLDLIDAPRQREIRLLTEASDTQQRIQRQMRSLIASAQLIELSGGTLAEVAGLTFTITRNGETIEGVTDGTIEVMPEDLIEVLRRMPYAWFSE